MPLPVDMARVIHANWVACDRWRDVHLPDGSWRLSYHWVHVPSVPRRKAERTSEIWRKQLYLPTDLRDDPAFIVGSNQWHTWRHTEEDPRRKEAFIAD
jgi:hypothetical protein